MSVRKTDFPPAALIVSIALHGAFVLFTKAAQSVVRAPAHHTSLGSDTWAGDTFDVELVAPGQPNESANASSRGPAAPDHAPPTAQAPADQAPTLTLLPIPESEEPPDPPPQPKAAPEPAAEAPPASAPSPVADATADTSTAEKTPRAPTAPPPAAHPVSRRRPVDSASDGPQQVGAAAPASSVADGRAGLAGTEGQQGAAPAVFGAAGPARGVRNLAYAFTRALPATVLASDRAWMSLPWGMVAEARVTFTIDKNGKIVDFEIHDPKPPPYVTALLKRSHLMLERGRFALQADQTEAGKQTYRIRVKLERRKPTEDSFAEPYHVMDRGFVAPTADKPGHAMFTFASGRHVDLTVSVDEDNGVDG